MVRQAIAEHQRLRVLFMLDNDSVDTLDLIAAELDHHIRFEERVLFGEIQQRATREQLLLLDEIHQEIPDDNQWADRFWE
ncbi:MAG: hypothetical protein KDK39_20295 [Leptospiraceae bacterium]|nr:hypothetical protein [Leptospiraceae bacterium]